jgi:hypothetical protein
MGCFLQSPSKGTGTHVLRGMSICPGGVGEGSGDGGGGALLCPFATVTLMELDVAVFPAVSLAVAFSV